MEWREALVPGALAGAQCVINFALDPAYRAYPADYENDFDLQLASLVKDIGAHYVMLSSRAAYRADAQWGASESSPLGGLNVYGTNKAHTEQRLLEILGQGRLTILRCANVVGPEWSPAGTRLSFMGIMMKSLRTNGQIDFDMSPFVRKDFVSVRYFSNVINFILQQKPPGAINLGSGVPVMTGELAMWLIEGFGAGKLVVQSPRVHDEFVLDVGLLRGLTGLKETRDNLASYCLDLGKELKHE